MGKLTRQDKMYVARYHAYSSVSISFYIGISQSKI